MKISARAGEKVYEVQIERVDGRYVVEVDGRRHEVDAQKLEGDFYTILVAHRSYEVSVEVRGEAYHVRHGAAAQEVTLSDPGRSAREKKADVSGPEHVVSAMPGRVVRVLVAEGDEVEEDQGLVVVEAMKMENEITASRPGRVTAIDVTPGQTVESGGALMTIE